VERPGLDDDDDEEDERSPSRRTFVELTRPQFA